MYVLKPIENGTDIKITGGIHTGCLRLQVAAKSDIKSVKDLKGKRIGVPTHLGSPPFLFTSRVLSANGIDPRIESKQVQWFTFPPDAIGKALADGRIDAARHLRSDRNDSHRQGLSEDDYRSGDR